MNKAVLVGVAAAGAILLLRFVAVKRKRTAPKSTVPSGQGGPSRPLSEYAHVLDIPAPPEYERKPTQYGLGIFSTRDVKKGEMIYRGGCVYISNVPGAVLIRDGSQFMELDVITHSVYRKGGIRELYAYDAFTNHSCDPNGYTIYYAQGDESKYDVIATKDIKKGDQIGRAHV